MSILDVFRKKDEVNLEDLGIKDEPAEEFKPAFPESSGSSGITSTDVQLIITKLDLINQRLENMDKRLQIIEKAARDA